MDAQTAKLIARIAENLPEMPSSIMQGWIENPKGLQQFLGGLCSQENAPLDTIIRVDRSIRAVYPDWAAEVMHSELANTGPTEYDLAKIELWLHDGQRGGRIDGNRLYEHLKGTDALKSCLGLRDGEEIQKKGIVVFRKFFKGKAVFLWRSVVRHRGGNLCVPYLYEVGGKVMMYWNWLDSDWCDSHPAARFAS